MIDAKWTTLGALLREAGGSIKTGPFGTALKAAEYSPQGVPVISVGEVGYGSLRITDRTRRVGPEVVRRLPQYVLRAGDVVFGRKGAVDRSAHVGESEDGYFLGSDGIRIRFGAAVDPQFIVFQLQSSPLRDWLLQHAVGTTMPSLNQAVLERVPISVPSIEEQNIVSQILSEVNGHIVSLERLIAKKQAVKLGMVQQLFTGRTRLPGYHAKWIPHRLESALDKLQAGVSVNSVTDPGPYGVLKTSCVSGGEFYSSERKTVAPADVKRAKVSPKADSLVISRMNTPALVGEVGYIDTDWPTLFLPDRLWLATKQTSVPVDMRWLAYMLSSFQYRCLLKEIAAGTSGSMKNISHSAFLSISVPFPPLEEQAAIVGVLADHDREIRAIRARLEKAQNVKVGMMQQLLTGRTRLLTPEAKA